ncbi:ABC transporter ATP-binding protein [Gallicola sp. Sow4_E12]|uniref:ABC transporter ATP-binding protein n=1 Tax=Gallicola sp. Sow4_E12 TaxID=3438785 RepID=UPI003F913161
MKKYILIEKYLLFFTLFLTLMESFLQISLAFILSGLVNSAMEKGEEQLLFYLGISALYLLVQIMLNSTNNYLKGMYIKKTESYYRRDLYQGILKQPLRKYYQEPEGRYLSLLTNNTEDVVDSYIAGIYDIVQMVSAVLFALVSLIYIDIRMIVLSLGVGILYLLISGKLGEKLSGYKNSYYDEIGKNVIKIKELLSAFEIIRNNKLESFADRSFNQSKEELLEKKRVFSVKISNINSYNLILGEGLIIAIISIVSILVIRDEIRIGELVAIAQLMSSLINPIGGLNEIINERNSSKELLKEQLAFIESKKVSKGIAEIKEFQKEIVLENLEFSFQDKKILKGANMCFQKGKKYAITGESGAGKSTICKLILNYFDHYKGKLKIDGKEYKDLSEDALSMVISSIHQDIFLFDGTIRENITLFKEIDEEKIQEVLRCSGLYQVMQDKRLGLDDYIFECGHNLSGGEKQRIAIARMLMRESPILILDEATSSLDRGTSKEILKQILQLKDKTCICITHKLSQEDKSLYDEIVEIKEGKIEKIAKTNSSITA